MKKHHNAHRNHEPKKRTREEVAARSQQRRETAPAKPDASGLPLCWDDLKVLHVECAKLLTAPAPISALLRNSDLLNQMGKENVNKLSGMAHQLLADVKQYKERLDVLGASHADKNGGEEDPTLVLDALRIGEEYQQWIYSYQSVVLPNIQSILDLAKVSLPEHLQNSVN